jgi:NADP-dependent 3-hydroxy acid dehydrogenase YdfG
MDNPKTYIISGAGSGIGRSIAAQLAQEGHQIILVGRNLDHLNQTKELLKGQNHIVLNFDIATKEANISAAKSIASLSPSLKKIDSFVFKYA